MKIFPRRAGGSSPSPFLTKPGWVISFDAMPRPPSGTVTLYQSMSSSSFSTLFDRCLPLLPQSWRNVCRSFTWFLRIPLQVYRYDTIDKRSVYCGQVLSWRKLISFVAVIESAAKLAAFTTSLRTFGSTILPRSRFPAHWKP